MWEITNDGSRAEEKRHGYTAYARAAVIVNDEFETRLLTTCKTIDEAKAALAKFVADENAEEDEEEINHVED